MCTCSRFMYTAAGTANGCKCYCQMSYPASYFHSTLGLQDLSMGLQATSYSQNMWEFLHGSAQDGSGDDLCSIPCGGREWEAALVSLGRVDR